MWFETTAENGRFIFAQTRDDSPTTVAAEAENVSRLSIEFQNVEGAFIDDTHGVAAHDDDTPLNPAHFLAMVETTKRHGAYPIAIILVPQQRGESCSKGFGSLWPMCFLWYEQHGSRLARIFMLSTPFSLPADGN